MPQSCVLSGDRAAQRSGDSLSPRQGLGRRRQGEREHRPRQTVESCEPGALWSPADGETDRQALAEGLLCQLIY